MRSATASIAERCRAVCLGHAAISGVCVRVIRRIFGVLLALIGLIVAVVGGAAAFWLIGPDNTVQSGEQHLSSKGLAIASTPDLLNRHGPVLHVDVRSAKNQPVFVGVARDFDVSSYLKGISHTKLVQVQFPIALSTQDEKGTAGPLAAPDTLDWWVAKANGTGTQSIAWPIEDGPYDVVIMSADGKTAPDVQVDLGIEIPKAFATALIVFAAGIILLALGILLILFRRRPTKPQHGETAGSTGISPTPRPTPRRTSTRLSKARPRNPHVPRCRPAHSSTPKASRPSTHPPTVSHPHKAASAAAGAGAASAAFGGWGGLALGCWRAGVRSCCRLCGGAAGGHGDGVDPAGGHRQRRGRGDQALQRREQQGEQHPRRQAHRDR